MASLITGAVDRVLTRSASKMVNELPVLQQLCLRLFEQTEKATFFDNPSEVAAAYVKLVQYRRRVISELEELGDKDSFSVVALEELERTIIVTCEGLYAALPDSHVLKTRKVPFHLEELFVDADDEAVVRRAENPPKIFGFKEPSIPLLDGRSTTKWVEWKQAFDREIHNNEHLSSGKKLEYLVSSIKGTSPAADVVRNYRGVPDGYELAYEDLNKRFGSVKKLSEEHVRALRDLPRRFAVKGEMDVNGLERLRQEAWSHVNALRVLKVPPSSYEVLTAIGIKESLPIEVLTRYFSTYDPSDEDDAAGGSAVSSLLEHLKKEVKVRRRSLESRGSVPKADHKTSFNEKAVKTEGKKKAFRKFGARRANQSACLQEVDVYAEESSGSISSDGDSSQDLKPSEGDVAQDPLNE